MLEATNQAVPKWLGPLLMAGSVLIALYGKPSPGVPHWVAYAACVCIFLGGVAATAISVGKPEINNYLGPLVIVVMATIPSWIAFGPGERHCNGGIVSFLGLVIRDTKSAAETECRVVFGFAAVLMWVLLFWGTYYVIFKQKRGK